MSFLKKGRSIFKKFAKLGKKFTNKATKVGKKVFDSKVFSRNTVSSLTPEEQLAIKLVNQSYQSVDTREKQVDGFEYQQQASTDEITVYWNHNSSDLYISFRGTKTIQDVATDVQFARHQEGATQRFQKDLREFDNLVQFYQPARTSIAGHSLGAGISLFINRNRNNINSVIGINPAFNLSNLKDSFTQPSPNVVILRTRNDPVSTVSAFSGFNVKTIPVDSDDLIASHKLESFEKMITQ